MKEDYVVFEISSEIARKIGGIYTVILSKSNEMNKIFGENYITIGFYDALNIAYDFVEMEAPKFIKDTAEKMKEKKIIVHYGKWTNAGNCCCFLIDSSFFAETEKTNEIKKLLWEKFKIDSLFMGFDFNQNIMWAWCVGIFIEELIKTEPFKNKKIISHFHEWISGAGLLYLKINNVKTAVVYTTHATVLGRSIVLSGESNLQNEIAEGIKKNQKIDDSKAFEFKIEGKHLLEKVCAEQASVFTTVSETMADEVKYILGKSPNVITLNAFDFSKFSNYNEIQKSKEKNKDDIDNLLLSLFMPYYKIELNNKILIYISGRYETRNKGIDIYIKALSKLNKMLVSSGSKKEVYTFIFVPTSVMGAKKVVVNNLLLVDKLNDYLREGGKDSKEIDKITKSLDTSNGKPPVSVYELGYPNDEILSLINSSGLDNGEDKKVKVIFYPTYLKPGDGVLNMSYNEVIQMFDIGVFPSRYEPFGYTPVEAGANYSIAVTTDLSGFGKFIEKKFGDTYLRGIHVLKIQNKRDDESASALAGFLMRICEKKKEEIELLKKDAREMVLSCNWKEQIKTYLDSYRMAIKEVYGG